MVFFSDGYSVSGKFTSKTGASSSKNKSYGYKGKKKTKRRLKKRKSRRKKIIYIILLI